MSQIQNLQATNSGAYGWADSGSRVEVNENASSLVIKSGDDSLEIPKALLPLARDLMERLEPGSSHFLRDGYRESDDGQQPGAGTIPVINTNSSDYKAGKYSVVTGKQLATLANVTNMLKGVMGRDISTAMLAISTTRSEILNDVVKSSVEDMQQRNQEISRLNSLLQEIRSKGPKQDDGGQDFTSPISSEAWQLLTENGWTEHLQPRSDDSDNFRNRPSESISVTDKDLEALGLKVTDYGSVFGIDDSQLDRSKLAELYHAAGGSDDVTEHSHFSLSIQAPPGNPFLPGPNAGERNFTLSITPLKDVHLEMVGSAKNKFAELVQNIKTEIDDLSSSSQLDMVKLQGIINKKNQSVELMTTVQQKDGSLMDKLISGFNR